MKSIKVNTRKSAILAVVFIVLLGIPLNAQTIKLPSKYYRPTVSKVGSLPQSNEPREAEDWYVFPAYEFENKDIKFMKRYRVVKENFSGNTKTVDIQDSRNKSMVFKNIRTDSLLLWKEGLLEESSMFRIKVLAVTRIQDITPQDMVDERRQTIALYKFPDANGEVHEEIKAFREYWFVYKYLNNDPNAEWVLIGSPSNIGRGEPDPKTFGWVRSNRVKVWNTRVVVQPNQKPEAIQERVDFFNRNRQISISAFFEADQAESYRLGPISGYNTKQVFPDTMRNYFNQGRMNSEWLRWPVLSDSALSPDSEILKVGVVGMPFEEEQFSDRTVNESAEYNTFIADQYSATRMNNIVFVIDATFSMDDYIPEVRNAVQDAMETLTSTITNNTFRFGAVLYTDRSELSTNCSLETCVFRSTDGLLQKDLFLDWIGKQEAFYKNDTDQPESMYEGILRGLELFNQPRQSNTLVLIGDASGKDGELVMPKSTLMLKDRVSTLLIRNKVSLIAIQAHNIKGYRQSYQDYQIQIRNLLWQLMKDTDSYVENSVSEDLYRSTFRQRVGPVLTEDSTMNSEKFFAYRMDLSNYPLKGFTQLVTPGNQVSNIEMRDFISQKVEEINSDRNAIVNGARRVRNNKEALNSEELSVVKAAILDFYIKAGFDSTQIDDILSQRILSLIEVYTPIGLENRGLNNDLLEFAIFLDKEEFQHMRYNLTQLASFDSSISQLRTNMKRAWIDVAKAYLGPSFDDDDLSDILLADLIQKVTGIPGYVPFADETRIRDFERMEIGKLLSIRDHIKEKLTRYLNRGGLIPTYRSGDQIYYWIPQRFLP